MAKKIDEFYAEFDLKINNKKMSNLNKKLEELDKKLDPIISKFRKISKIGFGTLPADLKRLIREVRLFGANSNKSVDTFVKGMKKVEDASKKASKVASDHLKRIPPIPDPAETISKGKKKKGIKAVGAGAAVGLAMLGAVALSSANEFGTFQDEMLKVRSVTGATQQEYKLLTDKARELGGATRFTNLEMAQAQKYFGMAGYSVSQINAALEPTVNLASATGESIATLADIVSDSMTAFGWAADKTGAFTDILAATATSTNTSVGMLGEAFKYVAPAAKTFGLNVQGTARMLGIMANNGIKASMAGTTLRRGLTELNSVSGGKLLSLGIDPKAFRELDVEGKIKAISKAFKGMTGEQQAAAAQAIFGQTAFAGMLTIINATEKDTKKLDTALQNYNGTAKKMADINNSGLIASVDGAKSAFSNLKTEIGEQLEPALKPVIGLFTGITRGITKFLNVSGLAMPVIITLAGALLGAMVPALLGVAAATWAVISPVLLAVAPFIAVGAAIGFVISMLVKAYEKFEGFRNLVNGVGGFFKDLFGGDNDVDINNEIANNTKNSNEAGGSGEGSGTTNISKSDNRRSRTTYVTNIQNNVRDNRALEERQRDDISYNKRRFAY